MYTPNYSYHLFTSPNPHFSKYQPFVAALFSLFSVNMVSILRCRKHGNSMMFLIFLSASSLTLLNLMAQGRVIHNHIDLSQINGENESTVTRKMIGSRPPRCERKCRNCGHCKAVQVPIAPLRRSHKLYTAFSRGDDLSDYKPMCWKCQCGNSFFNP
nr:PREDICTED: EPIDERMAL PATTERNING FACTOR-like protein 2 [Daucus carota subsp. sativus]